MKTRILSSVSGRWILGGGALVGGSLALALACGPAGFQSSTVIDSVRILATRVDDDKAYAHPGDVVTLEALTVDGRKSPTPPAVTYWIPFRCENPQNDLYYACFAELLAGDAGASSLFPPMPDAGGAGADAGAVDLEGFLPTGPYSFTVPADIIARHPPPRGQNAPYGLIIVFNIACAGHVRRASTDSTAGPQEVPLGCFDDAGNPRPPSDYVIGFTRVYVSDPTWRDPTTGQIDPKTDVNPRIAGFFFDGTEHDAGAGSGLPDPIDLKLKACDAGPCPAVKLDMDVAPSSWTPEAKKTIWVDYYAKGGSVDSDAKLLYEVSAGRVSDTGHEVMYTPPATGPGTLWAVVHDSNDGVTWLQVNVLVQ